MVLAPEKDVAVGEFIRMLQDPSPLGSLGSLGTGHHGRGVAQDKHLSSEVDALMELDRIVGRIQAAVQAQ